MIALRLLCVLVAFVALLAVAARAADAPPKPADYTITGPFVHDNLTLFLIHGPDRIKGKVYLTLQEAMEQKKVIVHETGEVNQLSIENVSNDDVYIQSGDIVKGGRQDRTIKYDLICSAHSGKMPLDSFCVESGRWQQRGGEAAGYFANSNNNLSSKSLKIAAKGAGDQSAVWQEVAVAQAKLSSNAGGSVNSAESATSLQLSLENKKVQEAIDATQKALVQLPEGKSVIGYAFAINGKLNSVDIYVSSAMFMKMWPKNLQAAGTEAFAEFKKDAKFEPVKAEVVRTCLDDASKGKQTSQDLNQRIRLVTRESKDNWQYETYDAKTAAPAHINIITRDPEAERIMQRRQEAPQRQQQFDNNNNQRPNPQPQQPNPAPRQP
ncbi:MAG: ARPP-1 family domain-containing protein [Tepidisphaerales bacterium]